MNHFNKFDHLLMQETLDLMRAIESYNSNYAKWLSHNVRNPEKTNNTLYTVIEMYKSSVKLKHPNIGGYFIYDKRNIVEVICEYGSPSKTQR